VLSCVIGGDERRTRRDLDDMHRLSPHGLMRVICRVGVGWASEACPGFEAANPWAPSTGSGCTGFA